MQHGSQQLAAWIERSKLTHTAAAGKLGIHKSTLSKILNKSRLPGRQIASDIRDLTGIPLDAWMPTQVGKGKKIKSAKRKTVNVGRMETNYAAG